MEAGDTLADAEAALGFPIATDMVEGVSYPDLDFAPSWESAERRPGGVYDRFASVRRVDLEALDQFKRVEAQRADAEVIEIVRKCIAEGHNSKMLLGKEAAKRAGVSTRQAFRLVERYTGTDPAQHRWSFSVGDRGIHRFELLPLAA